MMFFLSSIIRHTRFALVTGVQTCALPISVAREALQMVVRGEATVSQLDAALMHGIGPRFSAVGLFGGYVLNMRDADPDAWLTHIAAFDFGRDLVHEIGRAHV